MVKLQYIQAMEYYSKLKMEMSFQVMKRHARTLNVYY